MSSRGGFAGLRMHHLLRGPKALILISLATLFCVGYLFDLHEQRHYEAVKSTIASTLPPAILNPFSSTSRVGKGGGKGKRILVTGGAGAIGIPLAERLLQEGYDTTIYDIEPISANQERELSSSSSTRKSSGGHLAFHLGDIRIPKTFKKFLKNPPHGPYDGVIHLAGVTRTGWCAGREADCQKLNVDGTKTVLDALLPLGDGKPVKGAKKAPWFIYASSLEVYGDKDVDSAGTREGASEGDARRRFSPTTALGRVKLEAEEVIKSHQAELTELGKSSDILVLRPSLVYGSDHDFDDRLFPGLVKNALSDLPIQVIGGDDTFDFLHMEDAVEGFLLGIKLLQARPPSPSLDDDGKSVGYHKDFDLVSGSTASVAQLSQMVMALTNSASPVQHYDKGSAHAGAHGAITLSIDAVEVLGFRPQIKVERGLPMYIEHIRQTTISWGKEYLAANCPQAEFGSPGLLVEEDARNHNIQRLAECTVNIGVRHDEWMHHLKCGPEGGTICAPDNVKVPSMNWNQTVFIIHEVKHDQGDGKSASTNWGLGFGNAKQEHGSFLIEFEEEATGKRLGFFREGVETDISESDAKVVLRLLDEEDLARTDVVTTFEPRISANASYIQLVLPGSGSYLEVVPGNKQSSFALSPLGPFPSDNVGFDMRMTLLCCPTEEPWPLLLDDYETADIRFGSTGDIPFNSSSRLHQCNAVEQQVKRAQEMSYADVTSPQDKPMRTSSRPSDWLHKNLPACWNNCDNPSICVQSGACQCVVADFCPVSRRNPLTPNVAAAVASKKLIKISTSQDFVRAVNQVSWKDILLPQAARLIEAFPDMLKVHVVTGYDREDQIEAAECHKLQQTHCFSADSIIYRALRAVSVPADEAELIVLPVYQHCEGAEFLLHDVMSYASAEIPNIHARSVSVVMVHDWGICIDFAWDIWEARNNNRLHPDWILKDLHVMSVMGDYISACYRPHQDLVIPARTCLSEQLKGRFGDISNVLSASQRPHLMTWAGTAWGTSKNTRMRLICDRGGVGDVPLRPGGGPQSRWLAWDYMNELSNAIFCPQPGGIAGWSFRVQDAIYAGCIPLLMADGSHYPYADIIDWSKISVRVHPTDLDHIEDILKKIPIEEVTQMQANLLAIREAFLYSTDENPEDELKRQGPLFFAMQSLRMRLATKYPTDQVEITRE